METYQCEKLNEFRERRIFSLFPFIIIDSEIIWTGKWFKYVNVKEEKIRDRHSEFDDGWTYQYYWTPWEERWIFVELIK